MPSDADDWTWKFAPRAANQFEGFDAHTQDRIVSRVYSITKRASSKCTASNTEVVRIQPTTDLLTE